MNFGFDHAGDFSMVNRLFSNMWEVQGLKLIFLLAYLSVFSYLEQVKQKHTFYRSGSINFQNYGSGFAFKKITCRDKSCLRGTTSL